MKKKRWLILPAVIVLAVATVFYFNPEKRIQRYYNANREDLNQHVEQYMSGENLSWSDDSINAVNPWSGGHEMVEYILFARGNTYYGFYYSPDDVPLAFQNTSSELTRDGHDYWVWRDEGDNHGATTRLEECWYYFEASF